MIPVATTLPVSPSHAKKPGFYSLFSFVYHLGMTENMQTIAALNTLGKSADVSTIHLMESTLDILGIQPNVRWNDETIDHNSMSTLLQTLFKKNLIGVETRNIRRCSCGMIEYFDGIDLYGSKTLVHEGYSMCCHTRIIKIRKQVLVTAPLPKPSTPKVFPSWAAREFEAKMKKLAGARLLISRSTPRRHSVRLGGYDWNIDNDLVWWFFSKWLSEKKYILTHLVVGTSILHQAAILSAVSALIEVPVPTHIYCLPKVSFIPIHGVVTIGQSVERFGSVRITNALLWSALSGRKEFALHGSIFPKMRDTVVKNIDTMSITSLRRLLCV